MWTNTISCGIVLPNDSSLEENVSSLDSWAYKRKGRKNMNKNVFINQYISLQRYDFFFYRPRKKLHKNFTISFCPISSEYFVLQFYSGFGCQVDIRRYMKVPLSTEEVELPRPKLLTIKQAVWDDEFIHIIEFTILVEYFYYLIRSFKTSRFRRCLEFEERNILA